MSNPDCTEATGTTDSFGVSPTAHACPTPYQSVGTVDFNIIALAVFIAVFMACCTALAITWYCIRSRRVMRLREETRVAMDLESERKLPPKPKMHEVYLNKEMRQGSVKLWSRLMPLSVQIEANGQAKEIAVNSPVKEKRLSRLRGIGHRAEDTHMGTMAGQKVQTAVIIQMPDKDSKSEGRYDSGRLHDMAIGEMETAVRSGVGLG